MNTQYAYYAVSSEEAKYVLYLYWVDGIPIQTTPFEPTELMMNIHTKIPILSPVSNTSNFSPGIGPLHIATHQPQHLQECIRREKYTEDASSYETT